MLITKNTQYNIILIFFICFNDLKVINFLDFNFNLLRKNLASRQQYYKIVKIFNDFPELLVCQLFCWVQNTKKNLYLKIQAKAFFEIKWWVNNTTYCSLTLFWLSNAMDMELQSLIWQMLIFLILLKML